MIPTPPVSLDVQFERACAIADPKDRLVCLRRLGPEVDVFAHRVRVLQAATIHELRADGHTWASIGALLDVSAQRASQLATIQPTQETTR